MSSSRLTLVAGVDFEHVDLRERTDELVPDQGSIDFVSGFGTDGLGEIYILDLDGEVFQIVAPADPVLPPPDELPL